jgi:hypothetical protein
MTCSPTYDEYRLAQSLFGIMSQDGRKPFPGEVKVG